MPVIVPSELSASFGDTLVIFERAATQGITALTPQIQLWCSAGVAFYGMATGMGLATGRGDPLGAALWGLLRLSVALFLVTSLAFYATVLRDSMSAVGALMAGVPGADPITPTEVMLRAFTTISTMLDSLFRSRGWMGTLAMIPALGFIALSSLIILVSYGVLAITLFIALIEWTVGLVLASLTIPMGIAFPMGFGFLAETGIRTLIYGSIRLAVISFVALVGAPLMTALSLSEVDIGLIWTTIVIIVVIAILTIRLPSLVAGLLSGSPRLSAGTVGSALLTAGGLVAGTAVAGAGVATTAIRAGAAVRETARQSGTITASLRASASALRSGASLSQVRSAATPAAQGLRDLGKEAVASTRSAMRNSSFGQAAAQGRQRGWTFAANSRQGNLGLRVQSSSNRRAVNITSAIRTGGYINPPEN
jgi:type IV secretion system protein TrbL